MYASMEGVWFGDSHYGSKIEGTLSFVGCFTEFGVDGKRKGILPVTIERLNCMCCSWLCVI